MNVVREDVNAEQALEHSAHVILDAKVAGLYGYAIRVENVDFESLDDNEMDGVLLFIPNVSIADLIDG